ncbi:MAG: DRTGG domain-containing protein [Bacteroidales bacterium]|nr:DRTGG domain-containing protein [Bacteroidales bacterium]MDD4655877.1 DRTGG domain-containing protein [Bacteroidales bacterium]
MLLSAICSIVEGTVICGDLRLNEEVTHAFSSDLMSDVLTLKRDNFLLITGLSNAQSIRTAEMSDAPYILLCRGKTVSKEMIELANENNIAIISSPFSMFKCSGLLYNAGLNPVY